MSEESKATLERQARHVAKLGMASVENLETMIARARELLEAGEIVPPPSVENPCLPHLYAWQLTEPQLELPRRVWLATVEDFATGEGHSVYFAAGFAHDEVMFGACCQRRIVRLQTPSRWGYRFRADRSLRALTR